MAKRNAAMLERKLEHEETELERELYERQKQIDERLAAKEKRRTAQTVLKIERTNREIAEIDAKTRSRKAKAQFAEVKDAKKLRKLEKSRVDEERHAEEVLNDIKHQRDKIEANRVKSERDNTAMVDQRAAAKREEERASAGYVPPGDAAAGYVAE